MDNQQLAAAIRKGHTMVGEEAVWPALDDCPCCALSAAMYGIGKTAKEFDTLFYSDADCHGDGHLVMAQLLNITYELAYAVSVRHTDGTPRLEIAAWLEGLEPAQRQTFDDFLKATLAAIPIEQTA